MTIQEAKEKKRDLECEIESVIETFIFYNKELTLYSVKVQITEEETMNGEIVTNVNVIANVGV